MIDLEKIEAQFEQLGLCEQCAYDFPDSIEENMRALVAEVERLKPIVSTFIETGFVTGLSLRPDITAKELRHAADLIDHDAIMPCGHPRSAIVSDHDLGGDCTNYCGMCEEKVAKQYADEAMMEQQVEEEEREGEYGG